MKCAVIGGSVLPDTITADQRNSCIQFGEWLAHRGDTLLTGACPGFPHLVSTGVVRAGGKSIGYSPGTNAVEHAQVFGEPDDTFTNLTYLSTDRKPSVARLLMRSIPLVEDADAVVSIEGNWGTLDELCCSVVLGKPLVVVQEFGGAGAIFESISPQLKEACAHTYGEQVYFVPTLNDARTTLESLFSA